MKRIPLLALCLAARCVFVTGCASNPATGGKNVVMGSMDGEKKTVQKHHQEIVKALGLYDDQAMQEYVNLVGQRVAQVSDLPDEEFKFFVIDDEAINAFTTGCCNVYVNRGLLINLNSEAELAGVLGHEIGHITARHPARRQTRGMAASLGAMAAAILTGSNAIGQLANIGAAAWMIGLRPRERNGSRSPRHEVHGEGRLRPEPHRPACSRCSRPARNSSVSARRPKAASRGCITACSPATRPGSSARCRPRRARRNIKDAPPEGWIERHDEYLQTINGIAYGSSKAQGIVRDNRFYHADMGITVAFPRGWTIENQRDRLLAFTPKQGRGDADHDRREARQAGAARIPAGQAQGRVGAQG